MEIIWCLMSAEYRRIMLTADAGWFRGLGHAVGIDDHVLTNGNTSYILDDTNSYVATMCNPTNVHTSNSSSRVKCKS